MTAVAITGLAVGFGLGIMATLGMQNLKRKLRRKVNRILRTRR
jgi:hypothetical protein